MYKPFIFKLSNGNNEILDEDNSIILSDLITQPLISLGFHAFIHRTKSGMSITKNLELKNNFYHVVNPFEHIIEDYDKDIKNETRKYLKSKDDPDTLSRAFYKMWEIIKFFDLFDKTSINYAAIAEAPGSFVQAVIKFREKEKYDIKKDKVFSITIHAEKGNHINMNKNFLGYYNTNYPALIKNHKTYTKLVSNKYKSRDNGDITKVKTIELFKRDIGQNKIGLVTADGGFEWEDENYQEQEAYQLILGEIITCLKVINKGGNFVLKIFETFTMVTIKMVYLLSSFFEETYVYKPYFSRKSNSEKYLVCKNFKFETKDIEKKIKNMEKVLESMETKSYIADIFTNLEIPDEFLNLMKYINIQIANEQQIQINKMITYIKNNNYFGEKFHQYKDEQIKASEWWINNFFSEKDDLSKLIEKQLAYNDSETKVLFK